MNTKAVDRALNAPLAGISLIPRYVLLLSLLAGLALAADTPATSGIRNGGFEEGTAGWTLKPDTDFAEITVENDLTAPEGTKVLHISHQRTRSSSVAQQIKLEPFTYYLCSIDVRAGPYLRSGMGLWFEPWSRFSESDLGEGWQTFRFGLATGADAVVQINLLLSNAAGEVWLDNLVARKCRREDLVRVFGSDTPSGIPLLALKNPNTAEASVWHDEIPVSTRLASTVRFTIRQNLAGDVWKKSGRFCVELPASVRVRPEPSQTSPTADGSRQAYTFAIQEVACALDISLKKPLGKDRKARFWAEWEGGRQEPVELELTEIKVPEVRAPKEIVTGTVVYGSTLATYPDYPAVIRSLGFNHLDSWGSGISAEKMQDLGIQVSHVGPCPGEYARLLKEEPEARSTTLKGQRVDVVCLSSHGRLREKFLAEIESIAANGHGFLGLMLDDESYCDWNGMDTCFCDRCRTEWRDWLAKNRPGLKPLDPAVAIDDPFGHPEHYRAWWYFRAAQLTEWYRAMRTTFLAAVEKQADSSGRRPCLAIQSGGPAFADIKSTRLNLAELAGVFDLICPQYYGGGEKVARWTRQLVREVGRDKACPTLCMGERYEWQPGEFRAQILEALFAGARGYTSWGWPYSNLRVIAEAAETNGALATHEALLRQGVATETFWTEQPGGRVSVLETGAAGLLLVSNYSRDGAATVVVRRRPGTALALSEVFTGTTVRLTPGETDFVPAVRPGTCTLWKWKK